jgi:predicted permease
MPGARAASLAGISVLSGSMASIVVRIPGYAPPKGLMPVTYFSRVSSGYFRTLGIPLLQGRDFNDSDRGAERAVIVNQQFARQYLGGDALGKTFVYGGNRTVHVVGIAGDSKFRWIREDAQPILYVPVTTGKFPDSLYLQVRTSGDPLSTLARLREILHDIDRQLTFDQVTTMAAQINQTLTRERLLAFLSTLMAVLAITLAAIGIYGVLSFSIAQRTREIGIRMAVGAQRKRILAAFLGESAAVTAIGIAAGLPLALACGNIASSLLYKLSGQDSVTVLGAIVLLLAAAIAAAFIPAWRAARVDPMVALRHE